jgi:hypothetical protein
VAPQPEDDNADTVGEEDEVTTKLKEDLTCGDETRSAPTAIAVSQAIASAGGDCSSPAGVALAEAFASATASGTGQAFAEALAVAEATAAQKVRAFKWEQARTCLGGTNARSLLPEKALLPGATVVMAY